MTKYNSSIATIYNLRPTEGEVGIEVELEGENIPRFPIEPYWDYHRDPSLRGKENAEYVLLKPIGRKAVPKALDNLFSSLKKHGAKIRKNSPYTSVHVHLNFQKWSMKQTYNMICLWYIFENTLMQYCGEDRIGNLFCLRGQDAEAILMRLASAIRYSKFNILQDQDGLRYTALNATSLTKFGSLEFRGLAGVYDEETIQTWVDILIALKDYAEKFDNPTEIIREFSVMGPNAFARSVFREHFNVINTKNLSDELRNGMRLIQNVAYCVDWKKDDEIKKKSPIEEENERLLDGLIPVDHGREYLGIARIDQIDPDIMRQFADFLRKDPERGNDGEWYIDRVEWQRDQDRRAGRPPARPQHVIRERVIGVVQAGGEVVPEGGPVLVDRAQVNGFENVGWDDRFRDLIPQPVVFRPNVQERDEDF